MTFLPFVRLWVWYSAFACLAGWGLSALGQLNRAGYAVAFVLFAIFAWWRRKDLDFPAAFGNAFIKKIPRRLRRTLPLSFGIFGILVLIGSTIYPPTHYNSVTYHIPRVLQWLADGQWHWIHTTANRMNYSGCDFEWVFTPLLLLANSDRLLFLPNIVQFLLLPGLIFSVFTRLGVRGRVAWNWMWLLPTGYIFLLQAGSAGNDAFSAAYALAAIDFGCRAWETRRPRDFWLSFLSIALLTGTKPTGLPLLLPWAILIFPLLPMLRRAWLPSILILAVGALASFLPLALMNKFYSGGWLGTSVEGSHLEMQNPLVGIVGNVFQLSLDNFAPTFFPGAGWWNAHSAMILPHSWIEDFQGGFCYLGEMPTEDWAGIGFGLSALLLVSFTAGLFMRCRAKSVPVSRVIPDVVRRGVLVAPWIALLFFSATSAMNTPARLIAPYYPLLLALLLAGAGQSHVVRRMWWRVLAGFVLFLALAVLAISPDRPLLPVKSILTGLHSSHPNQGFISRALDVYTLYSRRSDPLADVRDLLPPGTNVVGFIGGPDDSDLSLWMPFGQRRVIHFLLTDPPDEIRGKVQYAVVGGLNLKYGHMTIDEWLQKNGAELVASTNITLKIAEGPQPWYVVQFKPQIGLPK